MPAVDVPAIIHQLAATRGSALRRHLLGEHAEWGPHEENTAQLMEVQSYQLDLDWARIVDDPDDAELRRERLEAKRRGVRPPKHPIVPPAAQRPPELAEQRLQDYLDKIAASEPTRVKEAVSRGEFDRAMGLV